MIKRGTVETSVYIEEFPVFGALYNIGILVQGKVVDMGIGSYEFWGRKGVDSRLGVEEFDIGLIEIDAIEGDVLPFLNMPSEFVRLVKELIYDDCELGDKILDRLNDEIYKDFRD